MVSFTDTWFGYGPRKYTSYIPLNLVKYKNGSWTYPEYGKLFVYGLDETLDTFKYDLHIIVAYRGLFNFEVFECEVTNPSPVDCYAEPGNPTKFKLFWKLYENTNTKNEIITNLKSQKDKAIMYKGILIFGDLLKDAYYADAVKLIKKVI